MESIPIQPFEKGGEVSIGDIVEIELNKTIRKYYLSPTAGGSMIKYNDEVIVVMSAFSPLGTEIIGLALGDDFEVEMNGQTRHYKIHQVY